MNCGLSPRGRGNPSTGPSGAERKRSIPAWAGEPHSPTMWTRRHRVYPRVGGGTPRRPYGIGCNPGLSPRGRGNPWRRHVHNQRRGSIPAWAGEPARRRSVSFPLRSIPAWAGEPFALGCGRGLCRVYPRVGGGTALVCCATLPAQGLSPRGRGNPDGKAYSTIPDRSIPAWAGEPLKPDSERLPAQVYPRVGGGTLKGVPSVSTVPGLSPRGRGNRRASEYDAVMAGSIPAWAGEPSRVMDFSKVFRVYPRVGGGTLPYCSAESSPTGLSPRGRGNPAEIVGAVNSNRSIPAWAGEPPTRIRTWRLKQVYPRVGGGTEMPSPSAPPHRGLSPRGRGNRHGRRGRLHHWGSIPAWAGEPQSSPQSRSKRPVYPRVGGGTLAAVHVGLVGIGLSPRGRGNLVS